MNEDRHEGSDVQESEVGFWLAVMAARSHGSLDDSGTTSNIRYYLGLRLIMCKCRRTVADDSKKCKIGHGMMMDRYMLS